MPIEPLCETGLWIKAVEPSPQCATALSIEAVESACDTALSTKEIEPERETAVPDEAIEPSSKSTPIVSHQPLRKSETILSTQAFECEMALLTRAVESLPKCEETKIKLLSEFEKALSIVSSRASPECETVLSTEAMPETASEARLETATEAVESLIGRETDLPTEAVEPECEVAPEAIERLLQYEIGVSTEEIKSFSECEAVLWTMSLPQSATAFLTESSPEVRLRVLEEHTTALLIFSSNNALPERHVADESESETVVWIVSNWSLAAALLTDGIESCSERVEASLM